MKFSSLTQMSNEIISRLLHISRRELKQRSDLVRLMSEAAHLADGCGFGQTTDKAYDKTPSGSRIFATSRA